MTKRDSQKGIGENVPVRESTTSKVGHCTRSVNLYSQLLYTVKVRRNNSQYQGSEKRKEKGDVLYMYGLSDEEVETRFLLLLCLASPSSD